MNKLPPICKHGKTPFEKKLLLYLHSKGEYRFELRVPDSKLVQPEDLKKMEHPFEFIPMYEIGYRLFLFKTAQDRNKAKEFIDDFQPEAKYRKRRKRNKRRKKPNR